jgi:predicted component of type VI protein secretion system
VKVVEGPDQGVRLSLSAEDHGYVIGRAAECDLPLSDSDVSRQHVEVRRRGGAVVVRDLGTKNGSWLGDARLQSGDQALWRPVQMLRVGHTVLSLAEPIAEALAAIESAPDEALGAGEVSSEPPGVSATAAPEGGAAPLPELETPRSAAHDLLSVSGEADRAKRRPRAVWSATDVVVVSAAVGVLALSVAGLVWLLRG